MLSLVGRMKNSSSTPKAIFRAGASVLACTELAELAGLAGLGVALSFEGASAPATTTESADDSACGAPPPARATAADARRLCGADNAPGALGATSVST